MSRPTKEQALVVVETAPNYDRDHLVNHVLKALQSAYDDGKRDGYPEARERALREQLSICRGLEQDARSRVRTVEQDLEQMLEQQRKKTT